MTDLVTDVDETTDALLDARASREPDYQRENAALRIVSEEMTRSPETVLRTLCEQVIEVCGAESAGVSLLEGGDRNGDFYWPAIAGMWSDYEGGGMPHGESPCGIVLERNRSLIFHDVEQRFPAAAIGSPRIAEILLAPFRIDGEPVGTVWALIHSDKKRFDNEDRRLLESLARFAAVAYQTTRAGEAAQAARQQLSLVNYELAHRLKNMLAMVMAVASQTLKDVPDRAPVEAFKDRLQALGSAHDILVDQTWTGASMGVVVQRVVGQLGETSRISISGPDLMLGPRAALSLSLMLHELGTNAIKYGALSETAGSVAFSWDIASGAEDMLRARWQEKGGPAVSEPERLGFGSRLIGMGLLGRGGVNSVYAPDGLLTEFEAPLRLAREMGREESMSAE